MFCDIEGFTGISEKMAPAELIHTLNEYFEVFSHIIDRHRGVITQFQGDAMLISFNTARPDPDHAANAVRTAIDIQQIVSQMRFGPGIVMRTRCGINTGELISGAVGTRDRLLFTVFGDEVNIAARLEQLNKKYGTYILVTEQTVVAAGGDFTSRPIGNVTVRGRTTPVNVYTIEVPDSGIMPAEN
jgi:adenylate cyclase